MSKKRLFFLVTLLRALILMHDYTYFVLKLMPYDLWRFRILAE